jgi:hypothetical protein
LEDLAARKRFLGTSTYIFCAKKKGKKIHKPKFMNKFSKKDKKKLSKSQRILKMEKQNRFIEMKYQTLFSFA